MHPYHTNDEPIGCLFQHTNRLFQELRRRLASLHGLEEAQPRIMGILAHDPGISQRELSERLAITPASTTAQVQKMEIQGLIQRRPDPDDQRALRLYLTEKGQEIDRNLVAGLHALEATFLEGLEQEEIAEFRRLLLHIHDNCHRALQS